MPERGMAYQVEAIEDSPFSPQDKFNLMLVQMCVRPACSVTLHSDPWRGRWNRDEDHVEMDERRVVPRETLMHAFNVLDTLRLKYEVSVQLVDVPTSEMEPGWRRVRERVTFIVADEAEVLAELIECAAAPDDLGLEANIGRLMGYPSSAVEAFSLGEVMPITSLPLHIRVSGMCSFLSFELSIDHWEKELAFVSDWVELVHHASPVIIEEVYRTNPWPISPRQVVEFARQFESLHGTASA